MAEIIDYPGDFFVWLDETGSDKRDHIRKFGYQIRGLPPVYHRYLVRGTRLSTISALSSEGLIAHEIMTGTTNGDKLYDFLQGNLIPCMQSFPAPRSILVMDNCSIHHVQIVKDLLQACGILAIFLPFRPLQVILWFLVHRPHQILFLDFYLIIGFLSYYFYYACAEWSMQYKMV